MHPWRVPWHKFKSSGAGELDSGSEFNSSRDPRPIVDVLRNRALFFRTLLANCVFIPGLGFLLVKSFP